MLELEALAAEANQRGMPSGKMRGILREYLQVLILKELYKLPEGKKLCFTGGTYLRLVHQAKRFSEDLDFNAGEMKKDGFEGLLKKAQGNLKKEGLEINLAFGHWENLLVGEFVFPEIEEHYGVVSPHRRKEGILIKFEANQPKWRIQTESLMVTGFGNMFPVVCTHPGALFADKIDALIKKNRARHLFDIMFMLSKKYPIDLNVLKALGINDPPLDAILKRVKLFSAAELKKLAEQLRPFLFEESEADLIIHAPDVIPQLIRRYGKG
ncbi:MAG: nucleotidyl transferase AbiEii/AbiGii toxin family protein [Candidatus Omnitrophota bacterium]|nr:nucleotidyl transferase AbiEii/AbiGii toxin family protein [Candidatus Omnitrophota bacterium]